MISSIPEFCNWSLNIPEFPDAALFVDHITNFHEPGNDQFNELSMVPVEHSALQILPCGDGEVTIACKENAGLWRFIQAGIKGAPGASMVHPLTLGTEHSQTPHASEKWAVIGRVGETKIFLNIAQR